MNKTPAEIKNFLEELLEEANIKNPTAELKEAMLGDLSGRLEQWLMMTIAKHLEPADSDGLEKLLEQKVSQEEIQSFLGQRIPDISAIIAQSMLDFKNAYLGKQ